MIEKTGRKKRGFEKSRLESLLSATTAVVDVDIETIVITNLTRRVDMEVEVDGERVGVGGKWMW